MSSNTRNTLRACFMLVICAALSSCILTPFISSFKEAGVTKSDRANLLSKDVRNFHNALFWGNKDAALGYVNPDSLEEVMASFKDSSADEHVVEGKVDSYNLSKDGYDADVHSTVRFYKSPYYIVQSRTERALWKFSFSDGWKIFTREVKPAV